MSKKSAVVHFIEKERNRGLADKEIRHKLLDAGWHMDIIQRAMTPASSNSPRAYAVNTPKKILPYEFAQKRLAAGGAVVSILLLAAFI
jgi:hypothetical protein